MRWLDLHSPEAARLSAQPRPVVKRVVNFGRNVVPPNALALAVLLVAGAPVGAIELLPADREVAEVIDHYVNERLAEAGARPAPLADDANLLRRTSLDLIGRPPTMAEAQAYLADTDPAKRARLVDSLLATPAYTRHQAEEFNTMLMAGQRGNLTEYLQRALGENRAWDHMFREMLVGDETNPAHKGATQFVRSRVAEMDRLAADASSVFFGVNVSCAQCHDHPHVPDWTQEHFYGMKSFFSRTFDAGDFLGESDFGLVKYATSKGEPKQARLMFLTGEAVAEPEAREPTKDEEKALKQKLEELRKSKQPPPAPAFSRRAALVEAALRPGNSHFFSRAIVNQIWARFIGRGLVTPLDQMHPENTPSHPELLAWLARDMSSRGYDLKRLIRGVALSDAYARSSRWESGARPAADLFAVAPARPLTPSQYGCALRLGSTNPDQFALTQQPDELRKRLAALEAGGAGLGRSFEQPREDFQISVVEALLMSNGERLQNELLREGGDSLLGKLQTIENNDEAAELAVWTVFSRPPEAEEKAALVEFLASRAADRKNALRLMAWALLTSGECRFNY